MFEGEVLRVLRKMSSRLRPLALIVDFLWMLSQSILCSAWERRAPCLFIAPFSCRGTAVKLSALSRGRVSRLSGPAVWEDYGKYVAQKAQWLLKRRVTDNQHITRISISVALTFAAVDCSSYPCFAFVRNINCLCPDEEKQQLRHRVKLRVNLTGRHSRVSRIYNVTSSQLNPRKVGIPRSSWFPRHS